MLFNTSNILNATKGLSWSLLQSISFMKYPFFVALLSVLFLACTEKTVLIEEPNLVPLPAELSRGEGHFVVGKQTIISVENEEQVPVAEYFANGFQQVAGWIPKVEVGSNGDIVFVTETTLGDEAYELEVQPENITIKASAGAGFFYALQSLKQLLPPQFYNDSLQTEVGWGIPSVIIKDEPALPWRGYMLDVSRHFFDKDQVKEVLDFMAELKLNRFHWHLTDDQGWRIEIKSYPKLTEIGAWRMDYRVTDETVSNWWGRPVQKPGEKPTYGGFYTQEDIQEIVAYAKERFIEVIPEIDMPGHAQATISAYPEIGCVNMAPYVATGGVFKNNTYNPGKEATFEFAEKMLNEVMDLFPYDYVHIGGDECNKDQWRIDPDAQARMKSEGLENVEELQSYFIKRIEKMINSRGKIMIGWDEILEGGLAPNATVMSWRGEEGGLKSVEMGHEVIMTPNKYCYIDLKQGHDDLEPNLGYSQLLLSTAYSYQVIPDQTPEEKRKLFKGIQANLWTESISDWGKLTYMTYPRLYAIAETAWTHQNKKNWDDFIDRLYPQLERLDAQKTRYAVSAFSPWIDHEGKADGIEISMKTEANGLDIYYTLDGTAPDLQSQKYTAPFLLSDGSTIKAQAYKGQKAIGYLSEMPFPVHKAAGAQVTKPETTKLTDLNYAKLHISDPKWVEFSDGLEIELQFNEPKEVSQISFNALRYTITAVYPPERVELYGSEDGQTFTKLAELDQTDVSHIQGRNKIRSTLSFPATKVKFLRLVGQELNPVPEGHHTAGRKARIKIDEVVVE